MTDKYGWRSFWWCNTAVCTTALVYQIFLLPETKWNRGIDFLAAKDKAQASTQTEDAVSSEKTEFELVEDQRNEISDPNGEEIVVSLSGRPSGKQFLPFSGFDTNERIIDALWLPFRLFSFPIIQWSSFVFSWAASCFLVANVTQSQALAGPPWNLSTASVGYTNIAIFVGASIALLTAGPLSDWISMRATIKNNGIREPEMRLPAIIPFACATLVGSVVVAVGYQYGWSWEVIVIIGYTLLGLQVASVAAIATTYSVCPPPRRWNLHVFVAFPCSDYSEPDGLVQAGNGRISCLCNDQQEPVGIWYNQIHKHLDCRSRLYQAHLDKYGTVSILHCLGHSLVFLRKECSPLV